MKTKKTEFPVVLVILGLLSMSPAVLATDLTAFGLIKEGNRYIGEQSKDKVVQIYSEKSIGCMTPDTWYVVYYDPDATLKTIEVKFGAGKKMDVKRPVRLPIGKSDEPLPAEKFKVDSDEALDIASKEPLLENLTLKASRLSLERRSADDGTPVWRIQLWASKLKNPNETADIGEVVVSAENGNVLKTNLKRDRVD
jgi:hypothetical protein